VSPPVTLSFFARPADVPLLLERLNADPQIAFIVPEGLTPEQVIKDFALKQIPPGTKAASLVLVCIHSDYRQRWRAVRHVESLAEGTQSLWHVPAGPLPLLTADGSLPERMIPDPWAGWTEEKPACMPYTAYFGPNWPAEIRLDLWTHKHGYDLGASALAWAGGPVQTQRWFKEMEVWFSQHAARLSAPRWQDPDGTQIFWAFPAALEDLKAGVKYYARGFDLDDSVRNAVPPAPAPR
jgi:hypothetical protein